ncbi:hypothetical protein BDM02DRAFT_3133598 [Thelephora ganbajun]|uniref:Uncharacterized protein n=1 Tax=Thelephora ganbajun TaxID=370292 RepID=A0ACB6ZXC9_THEGA|nr:hypothetical protein BDM02DRAFT_3133598 [Thelephora ganbajun]
MVWGTVLPLQPIILHPRPLQRNGGSILLVPLLPYRKTATPLPTEIWTKIFENVYYGDEVDPTPNVRRRAEQYRRDLLLVCKALTNIALPVFYSRVWIRSLWQLGRFTARLHAADKQWDSLRRIPYSAPGRWVRDLDLSGLDCGGIGLTVDELLTRLFPLLPFMATFVLNTTMTLSRRALAALTFRDGCHHLKSLKGIQAPITQPINWQAHYPALTVDSDPLVQLIRNSDHLEEIEIHGPGFDSLEVDFAFQFTDVFSPVELEGGEPVVQMNNPLKLNNLKSLSMLSTHASPLMFALLLSELPSLQRLAVTPYDDLPYPTSLVSKFIQIHGPTLRSLHLYTPKDTWPTISHPSPSDILLTCPILIHLSLEFPLPELKIPPGDVHPLQILSIPRPNQRCYQTVSTAVSSLKNLRIVRTRDVRWLRRGIISQATETGTQGEMRQWKRRLALRGVCLLDTDMSRGND